MNKLFPLPIYNFLKVAHQNGGCSRKGLLHSFPWLLKTTLLEPCRWIELATKNGKVRKHIILKQPVFILGYYRSGTTYLQQLFMQDDRLGHTSGFQIIFPELMLSWEKKLTPVLEFLSRKFKIQNPIHRIPLTWDSPGEEDVAMTTSLNPMGAQWGYFFPKKMIEYFEKYVLFQQLPVSETETWKQGYMFLLKKISLANLDKQLVLKSPPNTARIKLLLSLFPNAKFIFLHRNPYDVYASNRQLWKVVQDNYALGSIRLFDSKKIILDTYSKMTHRYLQEKTLIPPGHLTEICYEDFIKRPAETMKQIYESLHLDNFEYCKNKIISFAERQKKYTVLNHKLPPDEMKIVSENWEFFISHWNYPLF